MHTRGKDCSSSRCHFTLYNLCIEDFLPLKRTATLENALDLPSILSTEIHGSTEYLSDALGQDIWFWRKEEGSLLKATSGQGARSVMATTVLGQHNPSVCISLWPPLGAAKERGIWSDIPKVISVCPLRRADPCLISYSNEDTLCLLMTIWGGHKQLYQGDQALIPNQITLWGNDKSLWRSGTSHINLPNQLVRRTLQVVQQSVPADCTKSRGFSFRFDFDVAVFGSIIEEIGSNNTGSMLHVCCPSCPHRKEGRHKEVPIQKQELVPLGVLVAPGKTEAPLVLIAVLGMKEIADVRNPINPGVNLPQACLINSGGVTTPSSDHWE